MTLRSWHRASALLIAIFIVIHLANHLAGLAGVARHIAFMDAARNIYRQPFIEVLLLACVTFQMVSGLLLLARGWKTRRGAIAWLQAASGAYLVFFLLAHVGAVLVGRAMLGLDTNFYYAAAALHVPPWHWFQGPYYFLAVLALFTHVGCAAYWQLADGGVRTAVVPAAMLVGTIVSLLIVMTLAGKTVPVEVPPRYKATYLPAGT